MTSIVSSLSPINAGLSRVHGCGQSGYADRNSRRGRGPPLPVGGASRRDCRRRRRFGPAFPPCRPSQRASWSGSLASPPQNLQKSGSVPFGRFRISKPRARFPRVTRVTERLPIRELVPKQRRIPFMRGDVIDDVGDRRTPVVVALRHDGRATVGAHPAKRVPGPKQSRASSPTIPIPARLARAPSAVDVPGMDGATAADDDRATTGLRAIDDRHDRSGQA